MSEYKAPGVYFERADSTTKSIQGRTSDIFGFVGVTPRGNAENPVLVTSWNDFIDKFAGGLESPFLASHDLSYALYGFFQNGGKKAYISRVVGDVAHDPTAYGVTSLQDGGDSVVYTVDNSKLVCTYHCVTKKMTSAVVLKLTSGLPAITSEDNTTYVGFDWEMGNATGQGYTYAYIRVGGSDDTHNVLALKADGQNYTLYVNDVAVKDPADSSKNFRLERNSKLKVGLSILSITSATLNFEVTPPTGGVVTFNQEVILEGGKTFAVNTVWYFAFANTAAQSWLNTSAVTNISLVDCNNHTVYENKFEPIDGFTKAKANDNDLYIEAKDPGAWGNYLKVKVQENVVDSTLFDILVYYKGSLKETIEGVTNDRTVTNYAYDMVNGRSNFISFPFETKATLVADKEYTLSGGLSADVDLTDDCYISALERMKQVDELGFLCVPGITTTRVIEALKAHVENPKVYTFGIVDIPKGTVTKELATEFRRTVVSDDMAVIEPYGYVVDPLSPNGRLRLVPPSGHWCGYEAKNIADNGIQEAPAGTDAAITGFVKLEVNFTTDDLEVLNPAGIITLIDKKNYGIVIWGCRSCSSKADYRYITDKLVDNYIDGSVDAGTQYAVFRSNDEDLWDDLTTTVTEFLESCRQQGIIKGTTPASSYFVNCNEDINTEAVQKAGKVICEYGFAKKKPAEFVIHRVNHNMSTTTATA